jgi:hypothetical protein
VSPEPAVTSSPSPAGEPVNSRFFYVPAVYNGINEECQTCCVAGLEEQLFSNDIISGDDMLPEEILYSSYTGKVMAWVLIDKKVNSNDNDKYFCKGN